MTFGAANEKSFMHKVSSDEAESFAVMDRALEAGVNFIDTADVYDQAGLSERVVGEWLASRNMRDRIVLATKERFRMAAGPMLSGKYRRGQPPPAAYSMRPPCLPNAAVNTRATMLNARMNRVISSAPAQASDCQSW